MYKERKLIKVCIINFLLMIYRLITFIRCILCFEVYLEQNFSKDNINNYSLVVFKKKHILIRTGLDCFMCLIIFHFNISAFV